MASQPFTGTPAPFPITRAGYSTATPVPTLILDDRRDFRRALDVRRRARRRGSPVDGLWPAIGFTNANAEEGIRMIPRLSPRTTCIAPSGGQAVRRSPLLTWIARSALLLSVAMPACLLAADPAPGSDPLLRDVFTADPAPLVVGDTVYLYVGP
jgi:hypothetical protein